MLSQLEKLQLTQPHFRTTRLISNKKNFSVSAISKNIHSLLFLPLPQRYLSRLLALCLAEEGSLGGEEGRIIVLLFLAAVAAAHAIATSHLRGLRRPPTAFQAPGSAKKVEMQPGDLPDGHSELLDAVEEIDGNPRTGDSRYPRITVGGCGRARRRPQFLFLPGQQDKILLEMRRSGLFSSVLEMFEIHSHLDSGSPTR